MPASLLDSRIYRDLLHDPDVAQLFGDGAEVRAMLLVEGALAKAQGGLGLIPETAAAAIHRASLEATVDPDQLSAGAGKSAVPVPALVDAFRAAIGAPDHAEWVHWGATSQDIVDTALALRLRQALAIAEGRLTQVLAALARLARAHADLPMAGRTYGQAAAPVTFGAVAASWGRPLVSARAELDALRPRVLRVSLAGAAGTLSAMGDRGPEVRAALAKALDLADPGAPWHAERDGIAALAHWLSRLLAGLGRIGEDLVLLTSSEVGEVRLGATGASSTMPQKQNPVAPSLLVALARAGAGLAGPLTLAPLHRQQRDATAWVVEWLTLPQLVLMTTRALTVATDTLSALSPVPGRMAENLDGPLGLIHAEAISFALAGRMPRPEAQAATKDLVAEATGTGTPLPRLAADRFPEVDFQSVLAPDRIAGTAPADARAFADAAGG